MRDLLDRIAKMPVSIAIILIWIIIWILVSCNNHVLPLLEGKGISQIGDQYYRFFTAGLTHTHAIHLLANVCAMFWIGFLYENRIGSIRYLIIGVICAVLSQVIFLSIYRNVAESFGGSVYNYALCGFGLTMQLLVPGFPKMAFGTWSGNWLIFYLVAGNIPVLPFMNVTTLMIHLIAFAVGSLAALGCWRLGLR